MNGKYTCKRNSFAIIEVSYIEGAYMKKFCFLLSGLMVCALPLAAVSTCESRVDKNADKTTAQRVEACLTEETDSTETAEATEVILTDTYSVQYPTRKKRQAAKPETKTVTTYKAQPVATAYVQRPDYPAFRNDVLPQLSVEEANAAAQQAMQEDAQRHFTKPAKKMKEAKKPVRKSNVKKETSQPPQDQAASAEQIQQAQALQNDPQAVPQENALPDDFDESLLGPSDFGYNATDPAFQQ